MRPSNAKTFNGTGKDMNSEEISSTLSLFLRIAWSGKKLIRGEMVCKNCNDLST